MHRKRTSNNRNLENPEGKKALSKHVYSPTAVKHHPNGEKHHVKPYGTMQKRSYIKEQQPEVHLHTTKLHGRLLPSGGVVCGLGLYNGSSSSRI